MGNVLALTGNGLVLRQDDDPRHRPRREAHRGGRRPEHQGDLQGPQVGRRRGGQDGHHRARRGQGAGQAGLLRRRPRRHARRHRAVQDLHPRRRRRHQHLRPGQAATSGAPGPSRPTTPLPGLLQVHQGDVPGRQDGRPRSAGTSASRATRRSRPTSLEKIAAGGYQFNGLYELWPVGTPGLLGDAHRRSRPTSPTSCSSAVYGQDPGFVRQPGADRRPEGASSSASSSPPTA